jgi:hypothetical protein
MVNHETYYLFVVSSVCICTLHFALETRNFKDIGGETPYSFMPCSCYPPTTKVYMYFILLYCLFPYISHCIFLCVPLYLSGGFLVVFLVMKDECINSAEVGLMKLIRLGFGSVQAEPPQRASLYSSQKVLMSSESRSLFPPNHITSHMDTTSPLPTFHNTQRSSSWP